MDKESTKALMAEVEKRAAARPKPGRKKGEQPWVAAGISKQAWYKRQAKERGNGKRETSEALGSDGDKQQAG
jgi:hypothetical protein